LNHIRAKPGIPPDSKKSGHALGDVTLICIDPLSSYLGKVDSHNNTEVRAVLERVSEMAARRRVAVVGVTHFNKGDGLAINKIIGSVAFVAAARAVWMVAPDPDDENRRLFVSIKNNVGRPAPALAFRVAQIGVGEHRDIIAPYIVWDAEPVSNTSADQVLAAARGGENRPAYAEAADFLQSLLADGGLTVGAIQNEAAAAGLLKAGAPIGKDKAFRLAREKLGISRDKGTVYREGGTASDGQWFWRLPTA
jgi:putative DNA primase/helicase